LLTDRAPNFLPEFELPPPDSVSYIPIIHRQREMIISAPAPPLFTNTKQNEAF